jgi:phospholipase A1
MLKAIIPSLTLLYLSVTPFSHAQSFAELLQECIFETIKKTDKNQTLQQIEEYCETKVIRSEFGNHELGAISERMIKERKSAFNPYVITPHKMNYILPISITDKINTKAYESFSNWAENQKDIEAKFQLSIKVPLITSDLLTKGDQIFFGFTIESWWQLYTEKLSRPFRETNYQPELFYFTPIDWHPFNTNAGVFFGFEHQSNGRSELISRSWNRIYANFLFEKGDFALSFRPWYRIPEDDKVTSIDAVGDDNPDIDEYMGHFELGLAYDWRDDYEISMKLRENFSQHHGAIEIGFTFPLWGKLRGYAQYFNGYGESLIDYNHKQQRFGIGIALTDIL